MDPTKQATHNQDSKNHLAHVAMPRTTDQDEVSDYHTTTVATNQHLRPQSTSPPASREPEARSPAVDHESFSEEEPEEEPEEDPEEESDASYVVCLHYDPKNSHSKTDTHQDCREHP